jgi:hypothetical protein
MAIHKRRAWNGLESVLKYTHSHPFSHLQHTHFRDILKRQTNEHYGTESLRILTALHEVNKLTAFYGSRKLITVFITA